MRSASAALPYARVPNATPSIHRPAGGTWSSFRLLLALWVAGPLNPHEAARLTGMSRAAVSNLTGTLVGKDLLRREASAFFPFRPDYHRFASLVVLKAPDVPSILFESGYLTNTRDNAFIHSPEGQQQIATGMRRAIEAHFARRIVGERLAAR